MAKKTTKRIMVTLTSTEAEKFAKLAERNLRSVDREGQLAIRNHILQHIAVPARK